MSQRFLEKKKKVTERQKKDLTGFPVFFARNDVLLYLTPRGKDQGREADDLGGSSETENEEEEREEGMEDGDGESGDTGDPGEGEEEVEAEDTFSEEEKRDEEEALVVRGSHDEEEANALTGEEDKGRFFREENGKVEKNLCLSSS